MHVGDYLDNRYIIDRPIARGGMATVYRCVDTRLGREVAAKVMHAQYVDDPVFLERFRREARAMAQLSHPNLVNVYDFSAQGDTIFLIMELITGGTLRELLAERGPMPPHAATSVMRGVLTGLAVAHEKRLVHRDIKPDNVLISGDHRVKLADFGLVRAAADATHSTDQIVGTVSYLSPEQVNGSAITPASDVYSAGIVLFELLTGCTPFAGETPLAHAYARLQEDVPPPSQLIDGVPMLFDELVTTATAQDPNERFHDAGEFLDALVDVARDLRLPDYTVPVPKNSAANRAAAHPTRFGSLPRPGEAGDAGAGATRIDGVGDALPDASGAGRTGRAGQAWHGGVSERDRRLFPEDPSERGEHDERGERTRGRDGQRHGAASAGDAGAAAGAGAAGAFGAGVAAGAGAAGARATGAARGVSEYGSRGAARAAETAETAERGARGTHTRVDMPGLRERPAAQAPRDQQGWQPGAQPDHWRDQQHPQRQVAPYDAHPDREAERSGTKKLKIRRVSNRSGFALALYVVFAGVVAAAVGIGGWWFGSGMYGEIPPLISQIYPG